MAEESKKAVISIRVTAERLALVDQAATARGAKRTAWLDRLVERGLQGAGLLPLDDKSVITAKIVDDPEGTLRELLATESTGLPYAQWVEPRFKAVKPRAESRFKK